MSNFPSVKAKDFVKVIEKLGFYLDRQKGSHAIYKKDIGIGKETFFELLLQK